MPQPKFATRAIHEGQKPEKSTGAVMPPIYMTSTYFQEAPGLHKGYEYTRAGNPNFSYLEAQLASLERAEHATVFSSGLGALTAMISTLSAGDFVLAFDDLYGGTYRLFKKVFSRFGIQFHSLKPTSPSDVEPFLAKKPKWLLFETPTNPLLEIYDIELYAKIAKQHGVLTIVDNTFASPFFQNPLQLGADVVWHSTTKYISGHSDVIGGVVLTNLATFKEELDFARKAMGLNPSPFDTWLVGRGVKTLAFRIQRQAENAQAIANYLIQHPLVKKVYYPGLVTHPGHEVARKQMKGGFSGIISVEFNLPLEETKKLISSFQFFTLAESLGGVESLVCHPATMTHASIPAEDRERMGITDSLVRFSVGIEGLSDLIQDLKLGLSKIK